MTRNPETTEAAKEEDGFDTRLVPQVAWDAAQKAVQDRWPDMKPIDAALLSTYAVRASAPHVVAAVLAVSPAVTEGPEVLHWAHYEDDECIEDCPGCLRDEVIEALTDDESSYVGELEPADLVDRFVAAIRAEPYPFPAPPAVTEGERAAEPWTPKPGDHARVTWHDDDPETGRQIERTDDCCRDTKWWLTADGEATYIADRDVLSIQRLAFTLAAPSPAVTAAEDKTWGREKPHTLTRYGTTNCPVEGVRADVDDGECSACGAPVVAAVPEAQDGRVWAALAAAGEAIEALPPDQRFAAVEAAWTSLGLDDPAKARTFIIGVMVVAHDVRASAAVREGERERLAAAWDYGWRAGWDDREGGDGQVTPNAYWPNDAAPSLAAPEGTEQ